MDNSKYFNTPEPAKVSDLPDLPSSSASFDGGSNGSISTGRFASGQATRADLERGYLVEHPEITFYDRFDIISEPPVQGGFLGRPGGWER